MGKKRGVGDEAMRYLSSRMRTEEEMRVHLVEKDYPEEEIEGAIADLKTHKYIDDYEYAMAFYRISFEKMRGSLRTKRELIRRGVESALAQNALEDYIYQEKIDEYSNAVRLAKKEIYGDYEFSFEGDASQACEENFNEEIELGRIPAKKIASIARKLENLGYNSGIIYKIVSEISNWKVRV